MAEFRDVKGPFEAAGLTVEQVQEWLANPCTIALKERLVREVKDAKLDIIDNARLSNWAQTSISVQRLNATETALALLEGADAYASDK
jgi:hypothetical protein